MSDTSKKLDELGEFFMQRLMEVLADPGVTPADLETARKFLKDSNWGLIPEEMSENTSLGRKLKEKIRKAGMPDLGEMPFE